MTVNTLDQRICISDRRPKGQSPPSLSIGSTFPPPLSAGFVGSYTDGQVVEDTADRAERVLPMDNEGGD